MEGGSCKKRGVFGIFAKKRLEKHGSCGPSFVYIEQKSSRILEKGRDKWYNNIIRVK